MKQPTKTDHSRKPLSPEGQKPMTKPVFVSIDKVEFDKLILAREAALKKAKKPA